jgi:hypothetical protein
MSATPNKYCNLKTSKMGKLGTLFHTTANTLKLKLLLQQLHKKKTQKKILSFKRKENKTKKVKTTGLPPVMHFLYSHIARPRTLFLQDGQVS